ncbi:MAG: response regulator [Hyphomicrobiaceae bacterium]
MSESFHILFIDDDPIALSLAGRALASERHCISCAATADEALAMLAGMNFDLVIVDIIMPGMDGFEFLTHMRRRPEFDDIPALAVSVRNDGATAERALACGAQSFHSKPLDWTLLTEQIHEVLAGRSALNCPTNGDISVAVEELVDAIPVW